MFEFLCVSLSLSSLCIYHGLAHLSVCIRGLGFRVSLYIRGLGFNGLGFNYHIDIYVYVYVYVYTCVSVPLHKRPSRETRISFAEIKKEPKIHTNGIGRVGLVQISIFD